MSNPVMSGPATSGLRLVAASDTVEERPADTEREQNAPQLTLAAFNPGRPRRGRMTKKKAAQGASGRAASYEELVARVDEIHAAVVRRETEPNPDDHGEEPPKKGRGSRKPSPLTSREAEKLGLGTEAAQSEGQLEDNNVNAPPRDALSDLAEALYAQLLDLERSTRDSEPGQGPSMKVERNDASWIPGTVLFEARWQAPRDARAKLAPERRSTFVRISQGREYLEVGSTKAGFIEANLQPPGTAGRAQFVVRGRQVGHEEALAACLRHILDLSDEGWS